MSSPRRLPSTGTARAWAAACAASLTAAETSLAVYEVYAADAHFTRAVEAHARAGGLCPHPDGDADIFGNAAAVAYLVGAFDRAMRLAERALEILDPSEAPGATAAVTTTYALAATCAGFTERAFAMLDRIADALSTTDDTTAQAEVVCTQARVHMGVGHVVDSNRFAYRALGLARQSGARLVEGQVLATIAPNLAERGDFVAALEAIDEAVAVAEEVQDANLFLRAWTNYTYVVTAAGRYERAATTALGAMHEATPLGMLRLGGTGHNGAEALVMLGRWDEAEMVLRAVEGLVVTSCAGGSALDALLDLRRGNLDAVEASLARYTPTSPQGHAFAASIRAELAIERDDIDGCLALVDHALTEVTGTDYRVDAVRAHAIGLRAIVDRAVSDRPTRGAAPTEPSKNHQIARSMLAEAERLQREATPEHGDASPMITTALALCRAETARVDGDDPSPWALAAEEFGSVGDRYHRAYCRFREAEARLAHRGDRKVATVVLVEAWRSARDLGARRLVERCERLAERANIRLDDPRAHDASPKARVAADLGLTNREVEVMELLARNYTDAEIADELFISKKTASVHVSNILRKLDVPDRRRAGGLARDSGLGASAPAVGRF